MDVCPQCKYDLDKGAKFCSNCGYSVTLSSSEMQQLIHEEQTPVSAGKTLGDRFLIEEEIARGGMGLVFKAKDLILEETVALKVLKAGLASDTEMISRFKREIKVARKIKHPNVCSIYDFGTFDEVFFISMEFLDGDDMSVLLEREELDREAYVPIIIGMVQALEAAHRENIIHRDLKPSNIMIDKDNRPVIMDFGIARYIGKSDLTLQEEILGTPTFMSPEQFQGQKIDQRSDIYSLGVIMFQMYTGRVPFMAETPIAIAMQHLHDEPPRPSDLDPNIPPFVESIILKCMEKDPENRYQQVGEMLPDLEGKGPVAVSPDKKETRKTTKVNANEPPEPEPISAEPRIPQILVADDDPDIRQLISLILDRSGFKPLQAANGEEAIALAISKQPSLICLDLMMPKMDGYEAAEFLLTNEKTRHIPIVMITCKDDREYKAYSKSIGVKDYLTKPIDLHDLVDRIRTILFEIEQAAAK